MFFTTTSEISLGNFPILFIKRLLSMALSWSIIMSQSSLTPATPFCKCTRKISASFLILEVIGQTRVEGWRLFNRFIVFWIYQKYIFLWEKANFLFHLTIQKNGRSIKSSFDYSWYAKILLINFSPVHPIGLSILYPETWSNSAKLLVLEVPAYMIWFIIKFLTSTAIIGVRGSTALLPNITFWMVTFLTCRMKKRDDGKLPHTVGWG